MTEILLEKKDELLEGLTPKKLNENLFNSATNRFKSEPEDELNGKPNYLTGKELDDARKRASEYAKNNNPTLVDVSNVNKDKYDWDDKESETQEEDNNSGQEYSDDILAGFAYIRQDLENIMNSFKDSKEDEDATQNNEQ